ncbi:hypothetical protein BST61_g8282 [Cercospora zeina]
MSSNPHQRNRPSTKSQARVDSIMASSKPHLTQPPCTQHTIRHCFCTSPKTFPNVSKEDWKAHVRPVANAQRLNFGEPYDTFRRPLLARSRRMAGGTIFESKDQGNRFELKPPPYLSQNQREEKKEESWAPCDYDETGWGNGGDDGEDGEGSGSEGYEDMEVLPRDEQACNTNDLVLEWLRGQLNAERQKSAGLSKRLRTLEEECVDSYS